MIVLLLPTIATILGIMVVVMILFFNIVDETALMVVIGSCVVVVLALESASHIVTRGPSCVIFSARLCHLLLLLMGGRGLLGWQNLLLLELFTALDGMVEKVLLVMPATVVLLQERCLSGV